jgi:hypothetical protein
VHVVADTTDDQGFEALIVSDSSHVGPEFRLEVVGDTFLAFLRAEDYVDAVARVGV